RDPLLGDAVALAARRQLVVRLLRDGHDVEEIRAAARAGRLSLLPVQAVLRGTPDRTTLDLVAATGVDPELFERVLQAAEIPIPEEQELAWEARDEALPTLVAAMTAAGMEPDAVVDLCRALGEHAGRLGSAAIIGMGSALTRPGDTEADLAGRLAAAAEPVNAHLADVVGLLVRTHGLAQLDAVELRDDAIAGGRVAGATAVAIGFADVVGYTHMGERLGAGALRDVAGRLGELARDACADGVRVVKTIGDAVMLEGPRPLPVLLSLLALQERVARADDFPRLRAGVATGDAVPRAGDWFGPAVNRAARVCATARPESVLADEATRSRVGEQAGVTWTAIGRVRLKGLGRVPLHRARVDEDVRWRAGVHAADGP
ncbi:adenylate/guanylate cyclase domain-containing protein, partial [Patulibacter sp. S7RM1-6]